MNIKLIVILVGLLITLSQPIPVSAQGRFAGSLYLGYSMIYEDDAPTGFIGGRVNGFFYPDPSTGIGYEIGHYRLGSEEVRAVGPLGEDFGAYDLNFSTWQFTFELTKRFSTGKIRPFAMGGGGLYVVQLGSIETPVGTLFEGANHGDPGINLGGGLTFQPAQGPIAIGVEGRWHAISVNETLKLLTFMAGVNFN